MSAFEHISALLSFVYALALTHLLTRAGELIIARERVTFSGLPHRQAERLVREGEAIVIRQRKLVLQLGRNIQQAEELLKTFEETLDGLRKELAQIKKEK